MNFISVIDVPLTPKESNFIGQVGADLLIRTGAVPSNTEIFKEIIYRAMLVNGKDIPKH